MYCMCLLTSVAVLLFKSQITSSPKIDYLNNKKSDKEDIEHNLMYKLNKHIHN